MLIQFKSESVIAMTSGKTMGSPDRYKLVIIYVNCVLGEWEFLKIRIQTASELKKKQTTNSIGLHRPVNRLMYI